MTDRYFVSLNGKAEAEVTKEEYCRVERSCGFTNKLDSKHPRYLTTPATASFSTGTTRGRIDLDISYTDLLLAEPKVEGEDEETKLEDEDGHPLWP